MFSYAAALLYLSRENHPEPLPLGQQENFFKTSIIADSLPTWNINPRFLFFPLLLSSLFVFGIEGGKKERKGMKKGYRYTVFKYNFPGRYGGRGLAQSTIRYSYVGGIHTACPNSAASFCGKIRAFRDRLNNNRPGLKRSNSSPGDIAVQKIYTEYVFLHHDPPFFLFSFFLMLLRNRLIIARQIEKSLRFFVLITRVLVEDLIRGEIILYIQKEKE